MLFVVCWKRLGRRVKYKIEVINIAKVLQTTKTLAEPCDSIRVFTGHDLFSTDNKQPTTHNSPPTTHNLQPTKAVTPLPISQGIPRKVPPLWGRPLLWGIDNRV